MKRYYTFFIYIAAVLLSVLSFLPVHAQQNQDALYVFRNDGGFDAFFFGDIERISYSRIDTLGVEHDDYVVQEIWALDTVYRIPVSAIDSVAFVTPENKVKEDVFCPDKSIADYIIASDSVWWILLSPETPKELIPKEGDKLLIEQTNDLIPDGFGGRVFVSEQTEGGWLVATESTPITEIYDWLIVKAAAATPGSASARRRAVGLDGVEVSVPEVEFPAITFSRTFSLSNSVISTPEGAPVSISADLTGSIATSTSIGVKYRSFLFVSPFTGLNFDERDVWTTEEETKVSLSGSVSSRFEVPFTKNPKEIKLGDLVVNVGAGLFVEGSLSGFEYSASEKKKSETTITMAMNGRDIGIEGGVPYIDPTIRWHTDLVQDTIELSADYPGKNHAYVLPNQISIGVGVYVSGETKFKVPLEKFKALPNFLKKYLKKLSVNDSLGFKASIGVDVGAKIDFKCPWSLLWTDKELLNSQDSYKELNTFGEIKLTGYAKLGASLSLGNWTYGDTSEKSIEMDKRYIVPEITGINIKKDPDEKPEKPWRYRLVSPISHNLLASCGIGFLVVDEQKNIAYDNTELSWSDESIMDAGISFFKKGTYHNNLTLDPGKDDPVKYTAYPMIKLPTGLKLLADQSKEFVVEAARFDIAQRYMNVDVKGGYEDGEYIGPHEIEVIPNMENVEVKSECDWIRDVSFLNHLFRLSFYWNDLPDDVKKRQGIIRLRGLSQKGEVLVEDSIVVTQAAPILELSPKELEFGEPGGIKQVLITETNLTNLKLICHDDFLRYSLDDNVITVNCEPNTGEPREAYIIVRGKSPSGEERQNSIHVRQAGTDTPEDPDAQEGPFRYINFWTPITVRCISEGEDVDTVNITPAFNFLPENCVKFEKQREGNVIHFLVEGYKEMEINDLKHHAVLTFDIDKSANEGRGMVRNLTFTSESESTSKMYWLIANIITTSKTNMSLTLADFPLRQNYADYMDAKCNAPKFTSFSVTSESHAVYEPIEPGDYIDPVDTYTTYELLGDPSDELNLWILLNEEEAELGWPTDEVMQSVRNGGMPIYEGETPPSVVGTYLLSPIEVVSDHIGMSGEGMPDGFVVKFSSQSDGQLTYNSYVIYDGVADSPSDDMKGLIMGNGQRFSICLPVDSEESILFSGEMKDGAITNCYFTNTKSTVPGSFTIMKDGDGTSTLTDWLPGAEARKH